MYFVSTLSLLCMVVACSGTGVLHVDVSVHGANFINLTVFNPAVPVLSFTQREDVSILVSPMQCANGTYFKEGLCLACSTCGLYESVHVACHGESDTVCSGNVRVVSVVNNFTFFDGLGNELAHRMNLSQVEVKEAYQVHVERMGPVHLVMEISNYTLFNGIASVFSAFLHWGALQVYEKHNVTVRRIDCGLDRFLNMASGTCRSCAACPSGYFENVSCDWYHDRICHACSLCTGGSVAHACNATHDTVCFYESNIDALLIGGNISRLEFQEWLANFNAHFKYSDMVNLSQCAPDEYWYAWQCRPCTWCNSSQYLYRACGVHEDAQCRPCTACTGREYTYSACNATGADAVCYSLVGKNVTVDLAWFSSANTSISLDSFLVKLKLQTGAADILILDLNQSLASHVVETRLRLELQEVYMLYTSNALIYSMASRALSTYASNQSRRVLLQASCASDSYSHFFAWGIGWVCIPCLFDPIPGVTPYTVPYILWQPSSYSCPSNQVLECPGGAAARECVSSGIQLGVLNITQVDALACPPQQVLDDSGLCVGVPCGPGSTGVPGFCAPCEAGSYKDTTGRDPCLPCPAGTYLGSTGGSSLDACVECPQHSSGPAGSSALSSCLCGSGYTVAVQCVISGQATTCTAWYCSPCAVGSYWLRGVCTQCSPGSSSLYPASLSCAVCVPGQYTQTSGASSCFNCPPGYYQSLSRSTGCSACAVGTASSGVALNRSCPACGYNEYSDDVARSSCYDCPRGGYSSPGAPNCSQCQAGHYVSPGNCSSCDIGTVGDGAVCLACVPGTYSIYRDQPCVACPTGEYTPGYGFSQCSSCPLGRAGVNCSTCGAGQYSPVLGSTGCLSCTAGMYSTSVGAGADPCAICPAGTYWSSPSLCKSCPGFTTSPPGSQIAGECIALSGYYFPHGTREALVCPAGSYCPTGTAKPLLCPVGTASGPGATACVPVAQAASAWNWVMLWAWLTAFVLGVFCISRVCKRGAPAQASTGYRINLKIQR